MKKLNEEIIRFLHKQPYAVVTSIGKDGFPHNSCKGMVRVDKNGRLYLLDLYLKKTYENLKRNANISVTVIDEHSFIGYSFKGKARIIKKEDLASGIIKSWEHRLLKRISKRVLRNLRGERGHTKHPEALLPKPEYLIVVDVKDIVNLTPRHIKEGRGRYA